VCVPVHPRSGSHSPHRDSRIIRPLPHEARPATPAGLRFTFSRHRSLLLWELRSGWAGTGTGHPSALLKRFGEAKPHMTFRPIPEAPRAGSDAWGATSQKRGVESLRRTSDGRSEDSAPCQSQLKAVPGSPESPRLEEGPSALRRGNRDRFPGPGDKGDLGTAETRAAHGQDPSDRGRIIRSDWQTSARFYLKCS
jgi:hypothetical protein